MVNALNMNSKTNDLLVDIANLMRITWACILLHLIISTLEKSKLDKLFY